jgi:hypothetical protein
VTGAGTDEALRRTGRDFEHLEGVGTVPGQRLDATDSGLLSAHPDLMPSKLLAWVRRTVSSESEPIRTTSMRHSRAHPETRRRGDVELIDLERLYHGD